MQGDFSSCIYAFYYQSFVVLNLIHKRAGNKMEQERTLNQKLVSFKITRERYNEQMKALCAAQFTEQQSNQLILRKCSNNTVLAVLDNYQSLLQAPYSLTRKQIVDIAKYNGGSKNIKAVKNFFTELTVLRFTQEQIVAIAGHGGGSKNIEAVKNSFDELTAFNLTRDDIVTIVGQDSGSKHIETAKKYFSKLLDSGVEKNEIIKILNSSNRSKNR